MTALHLPLPDPALVVLAGAPGAGKSTLAHRLGAQLDSGGRDPGVLVSYDACREEISGDMSDQSATTAAVALAHQRINDRCASARTTVVDATHTVAEQRLPLLEMADEHGLPAVLIVVATPVEVCLTRQLARPPQAPGARWGRRVPADIVREKHAAVITSLPALPAEGWDAVHVLNLHRPGRHVQRPHHTTGS